MNYNYPHLEHFPIDKALNLKTQAFGICFDSLMSVDWNIGKLPMYIVCQNSQVLRFQNGLYRCCAVKNVNCVHVV